MPPRPTRSRASSILRRRVERPPRPPAASRRRQVRPAVQVPVRRRTLHQRAHLGQHLAGRLRHRLPHQVHLARGRQHQTEQHPDRGRLARAVGAEEAVDVTFADVEVEVVDREDGSEALGQPGGGDHRSTTPAARSAAASTRVDRVTRPLTSHDPARSSETSTPSGPAASAIPAPVSTAPALLAKLALERVARPDGAAASTSTPREAGAVHPHRALGLARGSARRRPRGGSNGAYWFAASAMSRTSSNRIRTPAGATKRSGRRAACGTENDVNQVENEAAAASGRRTRRAAGPRRCPGPPTGRRGRCSTSGPRARPCIPGAAIPATRRAAIRSTAPASSTARPASAGGAGRRCAAAAPPGRR